MDKRFDCAHQKKAGFTFIELLITISLMGMMILAVIAIDVGARRFVNTANYEAQVQSEVSPVLERMVKDIALAYGESGNSGINITGSNQITIRQLPFLPALPTYPNFCDDPCVSYTYNSAGSNLTRRTSPYCSAGCSPSWTPDEVIAANIENCAFIQETDGLTNTTVKIAITARRTADASPPTFENPRVTLDTSVSPRSNSLN